MIPIKTKEEIATMNKGGRILARIMAQVINATRPGVKTKDLDALAENLMIQNGGKPSFKMVDRYHWASCINLNDGLVHGIPNNRKIKAGDVVTIDLGIFYQGFHTDMARTFQVQIPNGEVEKFLKTGKLALNNAIQVAKPGNHLGHISKTIQEVIEAAGYSCSRKYTGHGVGKKLHEEPRIPCFLEERVKTTPQLKKGMVLAIEVIYAQGKAEVKIGPDGWTAQTIDGQLGGLFENTVAVTETGPVVLSML